MSLGYKDNIKEIFESELNKTQIEYKDAYWKDFEKEFLQRKKVQPLLVTGIFMLTMALSISGYFAFSNWKNNQEVTRDTENSVVPEIDNGNITPATVMADSLINIEEEDAIIDTEVKDQQVAEQSEAQKAPKTKKQVASNTTAKPQSTSKAKRSSKTAVQSSNVKTRERTEPVKRKKKYISTTPTYRSRVYSNSSKPKKEKKDTVKESSIVKDSTNSTELKNSNSGIDNK